jgi:cell division protein FtsB
MAERARRKDDDRTAADRRQARGRRSGPKPGDAKDAERAGRKNGRGPLGLATTRRAAVLAIVVCALALTIAVPLRTYLSQREDVEVQERRQAELRAEVQKLEERKAQLLDPAQVQAEARRRLRYVMPGETPFLVELPGARDTPGTRPVPAQPEVRGPWFDLLWDSITGSRR